MKLKDKVALITGGSQGIGAAVAERFAAEGARVAVVASRSRAKAEVVCAQITQRGGTAQAFVCDVADVAAIERVVSDVAAALGALDILVNAAGVFYPTPMGETPIADYRRMVEVNLTGTYFCINAIAPGMKARRSGKIINIASTAGLVGVAGYGLYCAVKAGIINLTRALACELAPYDINVNAVAPGNTRTPMNEDIRTAPALRQMLEAMTRATPSTHTYSEPEDIASGVLFLASPEARAVHGACLVMDEGMIAGPM